MYSYDVRLRLKEGPFVWLQVGLQPYKSSWDERLPPSSSSCDSFVAIAVLFYSLMKEAILPFSCLLLQLR